MSEIKIYDLGNPELTSQFVATSLIMELNNCQNVESRQSLLHSSLGAAWTQQPHGCDCCALGCGSTCEELPLRTSSRLGLFSVFLSPVFTVCSFHLLDVIAVELCNSPGRCQLLQPFCVVLAAAVFVPSQCNFSWAAVLRVFLE